MLELKPALKIATFVMIIWSFCMMSTLFLADFGNPREVQSIILSALICLAIGLGCFMFSRGELNRMRPRPMFLVTALNWGLLCVTGALPLYLGWPGISWVDALFESVSGVTTTGSTVLTHLDDAPPTLLLWRSLSQWVGGIGIILMAVAVLPFLKVGGMRLFQTESSEWSDLHSNRVGRVAAWIGVAYTALTVIAFLVYWTLGMSAFNAVNHAMTSLATGGYSTSDSSFGQFGNPALVWAGSIFMLLGGLPFMLYVQSARQRRWVLFQDVQVRLLLKLVATAGLTIALVRWWSGDEEGLFSLVTHAVFNVVSVITTTGYATQDYTLWGSYAVLLFVFLMFSGACSGSTSGGVKLFRYQLLALFMRENLFQSLHPSGRFSRQYNQRPVSEGVLVAALAFVFMVILSLIGFTLALALTGLDTVTAGSAALTALMNVGPGFGDTIGPAGNFASLNAPAKLILCVAMVMGRLEYLALIILFTPRFWRW